jgi:hypothetical protein
MKPFSDKDNRAAVKSIAKKHPDTIRSFKHFIRIHRDLEAGLDHADTDEDLLAAIATRFIMMHVFQKPLMEGAEQFVNAVQTSMANYVSPPTGWFAAKDLMLFPETS